MQRENEVQHVFLVGAKSLGAYGGYETFVYKLTEYHQNKKNIKYHVACKANGDGCMDETKVDGVTIINDHEFEFHNAHCFKIDIPQIGPAQAIYYDVAALKACCKYIKEHRIKHPIVYIMACRIGPFAGHFYKEIHKLGGIVYLNPDGHEWMRAKWSAPIRKYWKISEQMMVKYCDLAICDSVNIEKYIHECYDGKGIKGRNPKTTFIAYGADLTLSKLADDDEKLVNWYKEKGLTKKDYYLVVGRFVPENSFEVMIREFMKSKSKKDFAIITNVNEKFLSELEEKLHFKSDKRKKKIEASLKRNYFLVGREYPYKAVKPRIIAEKYMVDSNPKEKEECLTDYKFFCFDGQPKIVYVGKDKSEDPRTDFFNMNFEHLPIRMRDPNADVAPEKPVMFEKMKSLAGILSKGCPHLRVDFYLINNQIYVGELTFYHCSGFTEVKPDEWNNIMGSWIDLD